MLLCLTLTFLFLKIASTSASDSLNIFRTLVCDQEQLRIECPQHTKIIVDKVFYGKSASSVQKCQTVAQYSVRVARKGQGRQKHRQRILDAAAAAASQFDDMECDVTNARMRILEKCQNKDECQFRVNPRFFGRDPCPSTRKYLQISYKCRPSEFMSDTYCESSQVELQCLPGQALTIVSATYGRTLAGANLPNCGEKMLPGISADCQTNVLPNVQNKCQARPTCFFNVTDKTLRIPKRRPVCPNNVKKHLTLVYMCVDEIVFDDNFVRNADSGLDEEEDDEELADFNLETTTRNSGQDRKSMNDAQYEEESHEHVTAKQSTILRHVGSTGNRPTPEQWSSFQNSTNDNNSTKCHNASGNGFHCENETSANLVVYFYQWVTLRRFLSNNKSELLRYFCISAASGATLILLLCLANQSIKKYCKKRKHCSTNSSSSSSSSSSNSTDSGGRTSVVIDHRSLLKIDDHTLMVNDYSTTSNGRRPSPLTTTRQYYLTGDAAPRPAAVKNPKNAKQRRSSSATDFKGGRGSGASNNPGGGSGGFYKPAPDRASIDYMAIGSPLGADSLLEDEYYV